MKGNILLLVSVVLSAGLLTGCADAPLEEEIEVGYSTVGEPAAGPAGMAVSGSEFQSRRST